MAKKTLVTAAAVAVGLGLVGFAIYDVLSADEEAPIIVKNGSLVIVAGVDKDNQWSWTPETGDNEESSPSYSYEPTHKYRDRSKTHWVKVASMQSGSCSAGQTATGQVVNIDYVYGGEPQKTKNIRIRRGTSGWWDYRTKVRPSDLEVGTVPDTTPNGRPALIFPEDGFISAIRVDNWSCTFPNVAADPQIWVCASDKRAECQ
jgi:hypothetical protein